MEIDSIHTYFKKKIRNIKAVLIKRVFKTSELDLRNTTSFHELAVLGPLAIEVFDKIKTIPGWFNFDDCTHFHLILILQSLFGIRGDLLEIGSYHGRSTALMSRYLNDGEKIVVCDAFESETNDNYVNKPSPELLIGNIRKLNPTIDLSEVLVYQCLSHDLSLDKNMKFRFIHLDGGHSKVQVLQDLYLSKNHLVNKGIIAIDDYHNKHWPEVTVGVDEFLSKNLQFSILADLNRHGAIGRKLYIIFNQNNI
jgi:hypothetical protein